MSGYVFDNAAERPTATRFGSLASLYDPRTIRLLEATGVGPGWRCLEVGAGSGSIATWLADRVGDTGHVLATDLDPRFLAALADSGRPNVEFDGTTAIQSPPQFALVGTRAGPSAETTLSSSYVFQATTGGQRNFGLIETRMSTTYGAAVAFNGSITALYVPFGPGGAQAAEDVTPGGLSSPPKP